MSAGKWQTTGLWSFTVLLAALLLTPGAVQAMEVERAVVCEDVIDREPVNAGTQFPATVGKLFFFNKLVGAEAPTQVTHVWYYGDVERARVELSVGASSWRTYSSKLIQTAEVGSWKVEILDANGNILDTVNFEVGQR